MPFTSEATIHYIHQQWVETTHMAKGDLSLVDHYWDILNTNHTQKHRHYHNWNHIAALLHHAETHAAQLDKLRLVRYAIFYHDAIYLPKRKNNEEKSALLAKQHLGKLDPDMASACSEMILATKKHQASKNADTNFLLDIDLSIIGARWEEYLNYTEQIRKEYSMYPDFLYNPGRVKVLQAFLSQPAIYKIAIFKTSHEQQARLNLKKEVSMLTGAR